MIQQVQNSCQIHGLSGDDANKHLDKFLLATQSIKVNGVTDDALRLYLFPHSLTHHATAWFDRLLRNSINTFEQIAKMFLGKYFPPSMVTKLRNEIINFRQLLDELLFEAWEPYKLSIDRCPNHNMRPEECYDLIENMTAHHNDWDTSIQRSESSSSITSSSDLEIVALKAKMAEINKNIMKPPLAKLRTYMLREPIIKVVILTNLKANDAILKNMQTNMTSLTNSNLELKNMFGQFMKMNSASSSGSRTLPSNTVTNPKEDLKGITTRSGNAYKGPTIPTTSSPPKVVEPETKPVVAPILEPVVAPVLEPIVAPVLKHVVAPVSVPKPNQKPSIPYPSKLHDQKLRDKANDEKEKIFKIFQDLDFNISFADPLILIPKFGSTIKSLLTNKEKLMDKCLALADLSVSINLMPLSVWNKLSLPKLSPTCVTLKLADHSISRPVGVAADVFVKVGTFYFSADFVVVDFDADPRVPLILKRSFLKTGRALFDVYKGELTLRVGKEAVTFNLDQTSRYSVNYDVMSVNRIDLIDVACEEYS
uniref:Reverse transcriptase domain-containing protein n=1 Tax=Tanacetum cinerariifolium TaxID=118510 RepID=A0A699GKE9_TANCI|nr:reverse transcriptase domain-containing protein [Tanacetum cinerariifolium]